MAEVRVQPLIEGALEVGVRRMRIPAGEPAARLERDGIGAHGRSARRRDLSNQGERLSPTGDDARAALHRRMPLARCCSTVFSEMCSSAAISFCERPYTLRSVNTW